MAQTTTERVAASVRAELARQRRSGRSTAAALGWSPSKFARRLSGEYPFTVEELSELAVYLDVPLSVLLPTEVPAA